MTEVDGLPSNSAEGTAAERWELIERILNSRELKRSNRLRELLRYLGKQSIHCEITSIREQEIGEAVFERATDYDTSLDNIVRVNVTELRKRISLYFEIEGTQEQLQVEIPRGAYIPVFSRRIVPVAAVPVAEVVAAETPLSAETTREVESNEDPAPPRSRAFYRVAFGATLAALMLALCGAGWLWQQNTRLRSQVFPWQSDPAMRDFWGTFFESDGEADIVTADTSLALAEDILQRPVSLDDYLDYKYKDLAGLPGLTAETRQILNQVLNRNLGSVGDFRVAAEVMALDGRPHSLRLANARAFTPENVKTNNVILIGGPISNPWTGLYQDRLDFFQVYDTAHHRPSFINRSPAAGEQAIVRLDDGDPNHGYSIVAFLPNLSPHRYALLIAGSDSQATLAAGEWVTSSDGLHWIRQKSPQGPFPFFEVLLSNSKLVGTPLQTEVKAFRIHPRS